MSFTITRERDEDLDLLQITDFTTGIQVRILPQAGALLHEFSIPLGNRRIQVIDNYKNLADLKKNLHPLLKAPSFLLLSAGFQKANINLKEAPLNFRTNLLTVLQYTAFFLTNPLLSWRKKFRKMRHLFYLNIIIKKKTRLSF